MAYNKKNNNRALGVKILASNDAKQLNDRAPRFLSHAIVEVRKFKHLPFQIHSGVLLDISTSGFKLEFTSNVTVKAGDVFWLNIPLTPLGIFAPPRIMARIECKWFDSKRFRIGGVFKDLTDNDTKLLQNVVDTLHTKGNEI